MMNDKIPVFELGVYFDKYPVTVSKFLKYKSSYLDPWEKLDGHENFPVTNVSWKTAEVYAALNGKRLPTYWEWIYGAIGFMVQKNPYDGELDPFWGDFIQFPWGNEIDFDACNCRESGINQPTSVDYYDNRGKSPLGLCDMVGNTWEISGSGAEEVQGEPSVKPNRIVVGGSFRNELRDGGLFGRDVFKIDILQEDVGSNLIGFRCVQDFSLTDLLNYAGKIINAYGRVNKIIYSNQTKKSGIKYHYWGPPENYLLCDECRNQLEPNKGFALGTDNANFHLYCDTCFPKELQRFLDYKDADGHSIIFYGLALKFLIAYMKGDIKYLLVNINEFDDIEKFTKRCYLEYFYTSEEVNVQKLFNEFKEKTFEL